jgi:hypothetical protein
MSESYHDTDEVAAERFPNEAMPGGPWRPEGWSKTNEQLCAEARAKNAIGYASAFAAAGKHSQPPNHPWERDT